MNGSIEIKGARVHNLKNISLKIPRNKLVVITGVYLVPVNPLLLSTQSMLKGREGMLRAFPLMPGSFLAG
jgi:excinuclease UvrABC ATPase subunit